MLSNAARLKMCIKDSAKVSNQHIAELGFGLVGIGPSFFV